MSTIWIYNNLIDEKLNWFNAFCGNSNAIRAMSMNLEISNSKTTNQLKHSASTRTNHSLKRIIERFHLYRFRLSVYQWILDTGYWILYYIVIVTINDNYNRIIMLNNNN